jgi:hypothetical protein
MKKFSMFFLILIALIVLFAGCSKETPFNRTTDDHVPIDEPSADGCYAPPDIVGKVLDVKSNDNNIRVLVDSASDNIKGQIWVTIDENTIFAENSDGDVFDPDDKASIFKTGENVNMLSNGEIMESYPMQTTAICVFIDY